MIDWVVGCVVLAIWLYLAGGHGRFWRTSIRLPVGETPSEWPSIVAIVPARNEAELLPQTLPSLLRQRYDGSLRVILVDDDSWDETAGIAGDAGADVVPTTGPPAGWTGKVAALAAGVAAAGQPDYLLFVDADIDVPADLVASLVRAAGQRRFVLTSQMARLRVVTGWERLIVPAFVYFFAQLYPFARVNGPGRTAAAAGGCMLVERSALDRAGGLGAIRSAVIDDVALARLLKPHGRIWLGLNWEVRSVRPYPRLADLWQMIARSAYTQLRYSVLLLIGAVLGLAVVYALPPLLVTVGAATVHGVVALLGGAAWLVMAATFVPMLRFYRLGWWRAALLPAIAMLYAAMTVDSARRHHAGRGAHWKGRIGSASSAP